MATTAPLEAETSYASIAAFARDLSIDLDKLWNRRSSGSYFPPPVRTVDIPKRDGGKRLEGELGFLVLITVRNLMSVYCPLTKNPAHNEPDLLIKLVEAAGVEPASANSPWKLLHA